MLYWVFFGFTFFILGGAVGYLGSSFKLGINGTLTISALLGVVMFILGLNMLDVFPWAKKLQPTIPGALGKKIHQLKNINHALVPILLGALTFFLPCGFTQSMQLFSLSSGSFWIGAVTMLAFALGTLPVLSLISFSSIGIHGKLQTSTFFKTVGLIVIFFGLVNIINALVLANIVPPIFNF